MTFWEKIGQFGYELLIFLALAVIAVALELVITSKIKTWKKTLVFLVFAEAIAGGMAWLAWRIFQNGNPSGALVTAVIAGFLALLFAVGAIIGHRKHWKQPYE